MAKHNNMDSITSHGNQVNFDDELDPQQFSRVMLESCLFTLTSDGLIGKALQAKLEEANKGFDPPVDQEYILELVARYPDPHDPLQSAIESGNVKEVLNAVPLLAQLTPLQYGLAVQEIKDRYGKQVNLNHLERAVKDEKRRNKLTEEGERKDVADIAHNWAIEHRDMWAYDTTYDVWRIWNGEHWPDLPKTHLLDKEAVAALQEAGREIISQSALNTFERLAEADCLREFTSPSGLINFANGTLDLATGQLRNHSKDDNLTYCLPYNYDPYGTHPLIDTFLTEVLPDEHARLALMAHGGLALMGDTLIHNFYVLLGSPRSGKSTILALLNALCGASDAFSFAGHSLFSRDIEGKRSRYKWAQRPIVSVDELPQEALREEELLKAMTAHSGVEMRGMNRDEHTGNRWKPKLVMATNDQPRYADHSSAIKERAIFAEITSARPKEERDARLFAKLVPELGAFAASCLELAQQVLARGYYPLSAGMKQLIDRIAHEGNPLKDFVLECCIVDGSKESRIASKELHSRYQEFCDERGYKHKLAANTLSMVLRTMNIGVIVPDHPIRIDGKLQRGLYGIRLRTDDDPDPKPTYQDDAPLNRPERIHVYGVNSENKGIVYGLEQPVEGLENGVYTVSTMNDTPIYALEKVTPCNGHSNGRSIAIASNSEKNAFTPYTSSLEQPVERRKGVNGHKNGSFTPYTGRKAIPACPDCHTLIGVEWNGNQYQCACGKLLGQEVSE